MTLLWVVVVVLILLIPLLAIVIDSQIGQALARRIAGEESPRELTGRIETLEGEVKYLSESMEGLRDETVFIRSLIEGKREEEPPSLGPGD